MTIKRRPRPYRRPDSPNWWGRDPLTGKRISLKTDDYELARAVLDALWEDYQARNLATMDRSRVTLDRFRCEWLEHLGGLADTAGLVSLETRKRYDLGLRMLAAGVGDRCLLRNLTARKLSDWARRRLAGEIRGPGRKPAPMSPHGVNADLRSIKAALRVAEEWGYIERAPKIKMLPVAEQAPRRLMPSEVDALLAAKPRAWTARQHAERSRFWAFCLWTCLRRREALRLRWEHVVLGEVPIARVTGKGGKAAAIPLLPAALDLMGPPRDAGPVFLFTRADRPTQAKILQLQSAASNLEIARQYGVSEGAVRRWARIPEPAPYSPHPDTLTHWFKAQARAAGLRASRLHDLRHTGITYLLAQGVPPRTVQRIARHGAFATTELYAAGDVEMLYRELVSAASGRRLIPEMSRGPKLVNDY